MKAKIIGLFIFIIKFKLKHIHGVEHKKLNFDHIIYNEYIVILCHQNFILYLTK